MIERSRVHDLVTFAFSSTYSKADLYWSKHFYDNIFSYYQVLLHQLYQRNQNQKNQSHNQNHNQDQSLHQDQDQNQTQEMMKNLKVFIHSFIHSFRCFFMD